MVIAKTAGRNIANIAKINKMSEAAFETREMGREEASSLV